MSSDLTDLAFTLTAGGALTGLAVLGVLVLPWSDRDLGATLGAFVHARKLASGLFRVHPVVPAPTPVPVAAR